MFYLLEIREKIKDIYQKFSVYFNLLFKFVFSLALFFSISNSIGLDSRFTSPAISVILALVGAFVPAAILTVMALALCIVHLLQISTICVVVLILVYLIMWLLLLKYSSKFGYVFLAMPVLFVIGAPYLMPILMGMVATPVASVAIAGGTVMYYLLKVCISVQGKGAEVDPDEILQVFRYIMNEFIGQKEMYVSIIIFVSISAIVYVIRTRKMDHASEIAVGIGSIFSIVLFLLSKLILNMDYSVAGIIVWSLVSGVIVFIVACFMRVLDYTRTENLRFEDDDYYYYVKAVPKVKVSAFKNNVKNITDMDEDEEYQEESVQDEYDEFDDFVEDYVVDKEDLNNR